MTRWGIGRRLVGQDTVFFALTSLSVRDEIMGYALDEILLSGRNRRIQKSVFCGLRRQTSAPTSLRAAKARPRQNRRQERTHGWIGDVYCVVYIGRDLAALLINFVGFWNAEIGLAPHAEGRCDQRVGIGDTCYDEEPAGWKSSDVHERLAVKCTQRTRAENETRML